MLQLRRPHEVAARPWPRGRALAAWGFQRRGRYEPNLNFSKFSHTILEFRLIDWIIFCERVLRFTG